MAKALISTREKVQSITSWVQISSNEGGGDSPVDESSLTYTYDPVWTDIANSQRIAQIEETEFEVHSDLFWVDCNSSVTTDGYYYDSSDSTIKPITHVASPE
jgi:hypothetical protein